ncbi:MAG TPA: succinate dehydrogenase, cytochrome b556 subunit [Rhizomicrobium sp.]|jgi:succinate dehydrogenase / fumarate reductase cytochrome b subunit|nr:succinate dehydrogenase, cytochrome b556 subunit [Rhizomicrobium sp.]
MAEQSAPRARPLSPHLQIYRWPVTMATSIAHRVTGVALSAGTILLAWWLIAAAMGADAYHVFAETAANPVGQIVLFGLVWSLTYHLFNGIRHLAWDIGHGFAVSTANRSGVVVVIVSALATLGILVLTHGISR